MQPGISNPLNTGDSTPPSTIEQNTHRLGFEITLCMMSILRKRKVDI